MKLWHVSEQPEIAVFEPRLPSNSDAGVSYSCVWAVADSHLTSYLLPRECPRVAVRYKPHATEADIARFLGRGNEVALFIEVSWHRRIASTVLWLYELPSQTFVCVDPNAGYFVSSEAVVPLAIQKVESPARELAARGVELQVVSQLRPLAAEVAASSLSFSLIRLRNAAT